MPHGVAQACPSYSCESLLAVDFSQLTASLPACTWDELFSCSFTVNFLLSYIYFLTKSRPHNDVLLKFRPAICRFLRESLTVTQRSWKSLLAEIVDGNVFGDVYLAIVQKGLVLLNSTGESVVFVFAFGEGGWKDVHMKSNRDVTTPKGPGNEVGDVIPIIDRGRLERVRGQAGQTNEQDFVFEALQTNFSRCEDVVSLFRCRAVFF